MIPLQRQSIPLVFSWLSSAHLVLALLALCISIWCRASQAQDTQRNSATELLGEPLFDVPPSPVYPPSEALKTFQVVPPYRIELVASEPLVQDPVSIAFDPQGRIWVCEMRGFMPNIEGSHEDAPVGTIAILTDVDSDGVMDRRQIYLSGLILPRSVRWTPHGILVCASGTIWLCHDVDGDDRCDTREPIATYNPGNLEHSLNGLLPALDNWIYNAKEGLRLRWLKSGWSVQRNEARGQWGMFQDNHGFLRYNVNASLLRGDLIPCYSEAAQHRNLLVDAQLYDSQEVFPIRPTPGINRGYLDGFLRDNGSIKEANSNCSPVIFRGDQLPSDLLGDALIPEPVGNLIRRQKIGVVDGRLTSKNAYHEREFIASTDERFRPVFMSNGPDGRLYIVDMYRGIIQHGAFMTPYLRDQVLERKLDQGIHHGRIYRVRHPDFPYVARRLDSLSTEQLVDTLAHPNGWHRDIAQQLLVQMRDRSAIPQLERMALRSDQALARLHALWTLEGMEALDAELLFDLLSDDNEHVRASAITLYGRFASIDTLTEAVVDDVLPLIDDSSSLVRLQLLQALGLLDVDRSQLAVSKLLRRAASNEDQLDGNLALFARNVTQFLALRLSQKSWDQQTDWKAKVLSATAEMIWQQRNPSAVIRLCHLIDQIPEARTWQKISLLEGIRFRQPPERPQFTPQGSKQAEKPKPVHRLLRRLDLPSKPAGIDSWLESDDAELRKAAEAFVEKVRWPGGRNAPRRRELTQGEMASLQRGRERYLTVCSGCHHESGFGVAAKGPPLLGSDWLAARERLIRIMLHGLAGPIDVNGIGFNSDGRLVMPGMNKLMTDQQIADVLTYARHEFTESETPVSAAEVDAIRRRFPGRQSPWTDQELRN